MASFNNPGMLAQLLLSHGMANYGNKPYEFKVNKKKVQ